VLGKRLVFPGIQPRAFIGPVTVRLQRFHRRAVEIDPFTFVGVFDAPVDHIPQRRELLHLFLELGEFVRVSVRSERMTHSTGHAGLGQIHGQLFLHVRVAMKQEISDPYLLHENVLECFELFGGMLFFVSLEISHSRNENEKERCQQQKSTTPREYLSHNDAPFLSSTRYL
jgi:hypothetical protein